MTLATRAIFGINNSGSPSNTDVNGHGSHCGKRTNSNNPNKPIIYKLNAAGTAVGESVGIARFSQTIALKVLSP
jgi:hypothetical protein